MLRNEGGPRGAVRTGVGSGRMGRLKSATASNVPGGGRNDAARTATTAASRESSPGGARSRSTCSALRTLPARGRAFCIERARCAREVADVREAVVGRMTPCPATIVASSAIRKRMCLKRVTRINYFRVSRARKKHFWSVVQHLMQHGRLKMQKSVEQELVMQAHVVRQQERSSVSKTASRA